VRIGGAHDERAGAAHLLMQESHGVVFPIVRTERVGTDQFGKAGRAVRFGHAHGPHFVYDHAGARLGRLPGRFTTGKPAADDMDIRHAREIRANETVGNCQCRSGSLASPLTFQDH
jgi:hypothetical protein